MPNADKLAQVLTAVVEENISHKDPNLDLAADMKDVAAKVVGDLENAKLHQTRR